MKRLTIIMLLLCPLLSYADVINCKVVGITDGDTIKCLTPEKELHKIRLYQIDAPEKKQAFGTRSRQALSDLVFNKRVLIETHGTDKYRRILGTVRVEGHGGCALRYFDVNLEMIKLGMAWYYPFTKSNYKYQTAQNVAKANKLGLWSQKAIAPWEFRRDRRE